MKVTVVYEVAAISWAMAVEQVLRSPHHGVVACTVKAPGQRLVHIAPSNLALAVQLLKLPV